MSDIAHLRDLLSKEFPSQSPKKGCSNLIFPVSLLIAYFLVTLVQFTTELLPMPAEDFHRLDAAIIGLANERQKSADLYWQKIYFKLSISDVSQLKKGDVEPISQFVLNEMASDK